MSNITYFNLFDEYLTTKFFKSDFPDYHLPLS